MKRTSAPMLAMLLTSAAALGIPSPAAADHSWGCYHWARASNPFTLRLGDNVGPDWDATLRSVGDDWSMSAVLDTHIVPGTGRGVRPTTGGVEVYSVSRGNNGRLGTSQIWVSGCHITQGITKVNDYYFNQPQFATQEWRNHVMCRLVGRTIGLLPQDDDPLNRPLGTCMDVTSDPSPNQHPNEHDYEELERIYGHVDETASVTTAPSVEADEGSDERLGEPVAFDLYGRGIVFRRDIDADRSVISFVLWGP
jgi:hypothetical protein